jgi:hypothetical protein
MQGKGQDEELSSREGNIYLSVDDLAERWQVPKGWIYERTAVGHPDPIPRLKLGRYLRFGLDEIINYEKRHRC